MQRAKQIKELLNGLNTVVNLGSQKHYKDVLAVYKDDKLASEMVATEMRLAAENAIRNYKKECLYEGY